VSFWTPVFTGSGYGPLTQVVCTELRGIRPVKMLDLSPKVPVLFWTTGPTWRKFRKEGQLDKK